MQEASMPRTSVQVGRSEAVNYQHNSRSNGRQPARVSTYTFACTSENTGEAPGMGGLRR